VTVEVRHARPEELAGGIAPVSHYFGSVPSEGTVQRFARVLRPERMHVAEEDGEIVGGASAFELQLTVPGAIVPAAGVTIVGVLPTHTRRGILTQLMRAQLDDVHERGEPVACLWASEETIYGRYGYGMAALCGETEIQRVYGGFRKPVEHGGSFRLLSHEEALEAIPPVYARVAAETPGMFARSREWWEARALHDSEDRRDGAGEMVRVVLEREGEGVAYAIYRLKMDFEAGSSTGEVRVIEAMGVSPEATAGIWRYLLDVDWMDRVQAELLPVDHPLFLLLEHSRRMRFRVADSLWLRLVDVGAALAARSLEGGVVLEVADAFCPWNDARYSLDGAKTMEGADLRLDVSDLASVYLGAFTFAQLQRAGLVDELSEGAVARADAAFRTDRAPWCPEIF
jgi:predicted acetyltransferase